MAGTTIRDVAKKCGLSIATVSRVLSDSDYPVRPQTRRRILEAAEEIGYVPNMLARGLKTRSGSEIAVIIPTIQNPFYTSVVKGIEAALQDSSYNLLLYLTDVHGRSTKQLAASLEGKMIAGVIIAADCLDADVYKQFLLLQRKSGLRVALIDYQIKDCMFPGVFFDYLGGGRLAAEFLLRCGHTRIAYVSSPIDRKTRKARLDGFRSAFAGRPGDEVVNDYYECSGEAEFQAGIQLADQLLNSGKRYTAVAVSNDALAVGVLNGLARRGIRVPEEISVIGFDDCIYAVMCHPMLTTVRVPSEQMGRLAAQNLLEGLGGNKALLSTVMEPELVERASTAASPKTNQ